MRSPRTCLALILTLGALAPALETKIQAQQPDAGRLASRDALDDYYAKQTLDLDRRRIADLATLAAKSTGDEAENAYRDLFALAVARNLYDEADQAASAYLKLDKTTPSNRGMATFVRIISLANHKDFDGAIVTLDSFVKSQRSVGGGPETKPDPTLVYGVGEAFLQRLMADNRYDDARKVAKRFEDYPDASVKKHFVARLSRLDMLGKPAPHFEAKDVDDQTVKLADFQGKVLLVDFWATWGPTNPYEMPHLKELESKYGARGLAILGVSVDSNHQAAKDKAKVLSTVRRFLLDYRVTWPVVLNGTGAADIAKAFGVSEIPATFLVDRSGKILHVELTGPELDQAIAEMVGEKADPGKK